MIIAGVEISPVAAWGMAMAIIYVLSIVVAAILCGADKDPKQEINDGN